jgi:hypothetical protein
VSRSELPPCMFWPSHLPDSEVEPDIRKMLYHQTSFVVLRDEECELPSVLPGFQRLTTSKLTC